MKHLSTITVFSQNTPGVLYRIADLFLRRKINIESLTVSDIESQGQSRFTITVRADGDLVEKVVKQLYRIIEVSKVVDSLDHELIFKELSFIKVHTKDAAARHELERLAQMSGAKITYVTGRFLVIEKAGTEEEINNIYQLLKPYGIKEFVRSGRIAVFKE